ncbi:MAG TPA: PepSY-associated TM helix domain-containing protein [Cyclobacteriaceae bacterium]|nr:PepSY-associated TM helix domain-containing protein [Cyclobacteriaceae bacterium]
MQPRTFHTFTRRLHIHLGLLLLLFVWLFSLSGLLLNHGSWKFASFWDQRRESKIDIAVPLSALTDPNPEARVMEFLKISGEVQQQKRTAETLEFRVQSPGIVTDVSIDLTTGSGTEKVMKYNVWGKWRTLHTFNGMNKENPSQSPNWLVTNIWRFTMDGIAIGLIITCLSSWIMWYNVRKEYKLGYSILAASLGVAGYFLFWN